MSERFRCAPDAAAGGEPLLGTASTVRRWILVEQPGPWGADAVASSRLDHQVGAVLRERARAVGARLLLIRRHGRTPIGPRTCLVAATTRAASWVERLTFDDAAELLEVDWRPLASHRSVGGAPVAQPVLLVCTNGRHDLCCAELGRPLAAALHAAHPDRVWESSHYGGDRFAGNLVCLPQGIYYGRVDPADAVAVAAACARGQIVLEHYRGRSCDPFLVQAADFYVRERTGLRGLDDLVLLRHESVSAISARVTFAVPGGAQLTALVEALMDGEPRVLSCRGLPTVAPRYRLAALAATPAAGLGAGRPQST